MNNDEIYMQRCLQLAGLGTGFVAPNPLVGAVLIHEDCIIGEGYHKLYGEPHAEVNCIKAVREEDKHLITAATLYVSLEPCVHHGKTPPCTDLIIAQQIKKTVIGCRDPFVKVDGKGIEKLMNAGIDVTVGILENECKTINKRFFTFHTKQRPYIILKWAQTTNSKIAISDERLYITNEFTNRLVHKWRSGEAGILVGTNTALLDNPELTNRLWCGKSPVRLVLDKDLRLPISLKIFDQQHRTIIFNTIKHAEDGKVLYYRVNKDLSFVQQILNACFKENIQSILVEGGAQLLQSFINEGMWDEARIITNKTLYTENGLAAPQLSAHRFYKSEAVFTDAIDYYFNNKFSL
ncbi:MAG TPA: bifunctional diaminohydroxyphosphoribosylaminopyrimidine deaminase/5-amino-6-(5-phosphoribosylamino)uracil reductase RibD [Panacibacter sp.]|nr:bifunctional diaminohydroxyphosphoribosylaminopyrimidine deaminase/5-amino-6-(5-phosphoribosylamino)uracil reductase RibD [Panacibacter sp.]